MLNISSYIYSVIYSVSFLLKQIIITDFVRSFQRISLAMEKMHRTTVPLWQVMIDCLDKIPTLQSKYIADMIIFALGTPPDVEVQMIVNVLSP